MEQSSETADRLAPKEKLVEEKPSVFTPGVKIMLAVLGVLFVLLAYTYWNSFVGLRSFWRMPVWSHGYLVPVFAAVLLWMRWDPKAMTDFNSVATRDRWWGVAILAFGVLMRLVSSTFGYEIPDMMSFIPCLAGICLLAGGMRFFKWACPIVLFLGFMFPLPDVVEVKVLNPLQKVATVSSEYVLQTAGYGVERRGNRLSFGTPGNEIEMTVVEACSGLRMLTVFMSLCVAVALVIERPLWERLAIVLLGSIPIALASNIIRISATGLIHYHWQDIPMMTIHDYAGLAMMPVGMLLLWLFVLFLSKVVVTTEVDKSSVDVLGGRGSRSGGSSSSSKSSSSKSRDRRGGRRGDGRGDKKSRRPPSPIRP